MCGRYYVDDDTVRQVEKLVSQVGDKMGKAGDIHPAEMAPVVTAGEKGLCCRWQRWGFPGYNGKQLIFNARSESALEKKLFRESVEHRRIVVPATWFYEWNKNKEKSIFYRKEQSILYIAGFYDRYRDEDRFVILTTAANESMKPVHDRMPLLLERDEIEGWLFDDRQARDLLRKTPALLKRRTDFEQMSLFPVENSV